MANTANINHYNEKHVQQKNLYLNLKKKTQTSLIQVADNHEVVMMSSKPPPAEHSS